jgi:hypothetical protein
VVISKPDQNDTIKSGIGLAVATSVQAMPVGLARRSSYGIDSTECREGGFRVEAFRIAPRSDQESGRRVGTHAEGADQGRCCRPGESVQLRL